MADHQRMQNAAFNALLFRLNETVSQLAQLAQQYQEDVETALNENEKLRLALSDGIAGRASPSEASASHWEREANEMIPREGTCTSMTSTLKETKASQQPREVDEFSPSAHRRTSQDWTLLKDIESSQSDVSIDRRSEHSQKVVQPYSSKKIGASVMQHFQMRSPWIDQREFDHVTLRDVMTEEKFEACQSGTVHLGGFDFETFENNVLDNVQGGNLSWLVVHPEARARGWWVLACMALLLYDLIMVPVDVCFDLEETAFSKVMDVTAATFWTMDIAFTFFVGVRQAYTVEMNPSRIARSYLKTWFMFDMFLVVPEWVTMAIANDSFSGAQVSVFRMARWGRLMRLLRMARILRISRHRRLMRRLIYVFNLSKVYIQLMQTMAGLSLALIAFFHIMSCFWYAIGNSSDDGWVSINGLGSASVGQAYAASLHWSFSRLHGMQTYNKMESVTELVLDTLLIYVSLMLAAYYNGTVAAVAMTSANAQSFNLWKLSILYVKRHKISSGLDMKMAKFLESSGVGGAMETAAEELTLLESLPKTLQHDLLFEARVPFLSSKPFLNDLLAANARVIRQICTEAIAQKVYVDGEVVFAIGDACHGMLFVMSGVLYYILDNVYVARKRLANIQERLYNLMSTGPLRVADSSTREVEANSSLSEPVLWTHWTHVGSLLTIEESTSLVLSTHEFSQVVAEHREAFCYAYKYAKKFLWLLNHTPDDIDDLTAYHEITVNDLDTDLFEGTEYNHFMFLSHYKVEAGTEATLMRDLFQEILREDPNHSANTLRSPIFVDSEDLTDLSKLKEHVTGSTALVLLLTPGVLSRPWCLVEIVTAVNHKVNIVPVEIQRPGSRYNYPDDQFYANILEGRFLEQSATDLLKGEGISLSDVEKAIRQVFLKIALPFSPQKTKGVREAELHDILARSSPGQDHPAY